MYIHITVDVYDLEKCIYIYPPPCLRHAGRVVRTAVCLLNLQLPAGNPSGIPDLLLDLHPLAGNPSGTRAASAKESDRFRRELTESQFSQRSKYPGNLENATTLTRNLLFLFQMPSNGAGGALACAAGPSSWEPLRAPKIQQKSNRNSTAKTLPKKLLGGPKWRSKGSQHGPQIDPKPSKLTSGALLGRASGKKHVNIKSV